MLLPCPHTMIRGCENVAFSVGHGHDTGQHASHQTNLDVKDLKILATQAGSQYSRQNHGMVT